MKTTLELHASRVLEIGQEEAGIGFVLLRGYVYLSEEEWGGVGQSGWQNVRLRLAGMEMEGPECAPGSYISDGALTANSLLFGDMIPFSVSGTKGDVCLTLRASDDFTVRIIHARSISIGAEGEFQLETLWAGN